MLQMSNYLPILAAAAVHISLSVVWYSDYAFGKTWKKVSGCKIKTQNLYTKFALQAALSVLTATALMIAINIFEQYQMIGATQSGFTKIFSWFLSNTQQGPSLMNVMKIASFFWLGFIMPVHAATMIWCETHLHKFLIDAGCELFALVGVAVTLAVLV